MSGNTQPKEKEYRTLSETPSDRPMKSWADFANSFLFRFFEGRSFSIWLFVSTLLIFLYVKYAQFDEGVLEGRLGQVALVLLGLLLLYTLYKNFVFSDPWGLGNKIRAKLKLPERYTENSWLAETLGGEPKKLNLPLNAINFRRLYSRIKIINPGGGRWRAGFVFECPDGSREYIFHAYQDARNPDFRIRILERQPGVKDFTERDIDKPIGVRDIKDFELELVNKDKKLHFYVNGVAAGSYDVPLNTISNVILAAWSDDQPIRILFENIEAWV